jgi:hypothetical protein
LLKVLLDGGQAPLRPARHRGMQTGQDVMGGSGRQMWKDQLAFLAGVLGTVVRATVIGFCGLPGWPKSASQRRATPVRPPRRTLLRSVMRRQATTLSASESCSQLVMSCSRPSSVTFFGGGAAKTERSGHKSCK